MKKGLVFFLGMISGVVLTFLIFLFIGLANRNNGTGDAVYSDPGISMFSEAGETMQLKSFQVFQVLSNGSALARSSEKSKVQYNFEYGDPIVLLLPDEKSAFYDDQIIKVSANKVVRQVGTYRYETKMEFVKTVPVVAIFDK